MGLALVGIGLYLLLKCSPWSKSDSKGCFFILVTIVRSKSSHCQLHGRIWILIVPKNIGKGISGLKPPRPWWFQRCFFVTALHDESTPTGGGRVAGATCRRREIHSSEWIWRWFEDVRGKLTFVAGWYGLIMNGVRNVIMFSLSLSLSLSVSLSLSLIAKHNELFEPEHPLCCRQEAVGGCCLRWEAFRDVYIYIYTY